jgi:hypothetical protein
MVTFKTRIQKFKKQGEKTGWTYIEISKAQAEKIYPGNRKSFRVKGKFDDFSVERQSLLPMGNGNFIVPLNAKIRKALKKKEGDMLNVSITLDKRKPTLSADLMDCLKTEPESLAFFKSLPKSHQNYFSGWVESAKTIQTKTKRILMAMNAFAKKQGFPEMLREHKGAQ